MSKIHLEPGLEAQGVELGNDLPEAGSIPRGRGPACLQQRPQRRRCQVRCPQTQFLLSEEMQHRVVRVLVVGQLPLMEYLPHATRPGPSVRLGRVLVFEHGLVRHPTKWDQLQQRELNDFNI